MIKSFFYNRRVKQVQDESNSMDDASKIRTVMPLINGKTRDEHAKDLYKQIINTNLVYTIIEPETFDGSNFIPETRREYMNLSASQISALTSYVNNNNNLYLYDNMEDILDMIDKKDIWCKYSELFNSIVNKRSMPTTYEEYKIANENFEYDIMTEFMVSYKHILSM